MKKLMFFSFIGFCLFAQAQDSSDKTQEAYAIIEEIAKNFPNDICSYLHVAGISTHCILHSSPEAFKPIPNCFSILAEPSTNFKVLVFKAITNLNCSYHLDQLDEIIDELKLRGETRPAGSDIKKYMTPLAQCMEPFVSQGLIDNGCETIDYSIFLNLPSEIISIKPKSPAYKRFFSFLISFF